jgi:lipopolysaccharide export system permease protein
MFLIGAPLGSIIKKGGLGVPVLVSILFFILYYVLDLMGTKWAKQDVISVPVGVWMANFILFWIGMVFLRQARVDARLFDADFYNVVVDKVKKRISLLKGQPKVA